MHITVAVGSPFEDKVLNYEVVQKPRSRPLKHNPGGGHLDRMYACCSSLLLRARDITEKYGS